MRSSEAGRPIGIPVVVERATEAPRARQMQRAITTSGNRQIDGVRQRTLSGD